MYSKDNSMPLCLLPLRTSKELEDFLNDRNRNSDTSIIEGAKSLLDPKSRLPIIKWARKYTFLKLQHDIIAGITVALTVIPQGMAYALVAGLPAEYGLYSSFVGPLIYTLLGTSKDITMGPTAVMSLIVAAYSQSKYPQYAIMLCFCCGVTQVLMALFQLGFLVNFFSHSVINAFTSAASAIIAVSQLKDILGIPHLPREFFHQIFEIGHRIEETHLYDLCLGSSCLIILLALRNLNKFDINSSNKSMGWQAIRKSKWLICTSRNAIVVLCASAIVFILHIHHIDPFRRVGIVPEGMPPLAFPSFSINDSHTNFTVSTVEMFESVATGLVIVPVMGLLESIAIAKAFARKNNYRIDPTQELFAIGIGNVVASFFSSYPITGSFSRTAVNSQCGVATPLSGVFTATVVILALLFLAPFFHYIPKASLAAVIISAVIFNFDYKIIFHLWKVKKSDLFVVLTTLITSLVFGIEYGIIIGAIVSFAVLLGPMANPNIQHKFFKDTVIFKFGSGFFFPAVEKFHDSIDDAFYTYRKSGSEIKLTIIFDLSNLWKVDFTGVLSLVETYRYLSKAGHTVHFLGANFEVEETLSNELKYFSKSDSSSILIHSISDCNAKLNNVVTTNL